MLLFGQEVLVEKCYPLEDADEDIADDDLGSGEASLNTQRHSSSHSDSLRVRPHCEFLDKEKDCII